MLPQSKLFQVYQALVESHLRYGNIWGHLSATKLNKLQRLQDRAIALIQSAPIKDRMPSATLSVNELIKLDQAYINKSLIKRSQKDLRFQNMKQEDRMTCRYQELGLK